MLLALAGAGIAPDAATAIRDQAERVATVRRTRNDDGYRADAGYWDGVTLLTFEEFDELAEIEVDTQDGSVVVSVTAGGGLVARIGVRGVPVDSPHKLIANRVRIIRLSERLTKQVATTFTGWVARYVERGLLTRLADPAPQAMFVAAQADDAYRNAPSGYWELVRQANGACVGSDLYAIVGLGEVEPFEVSGRTVVPLIDLRDGGAVVTPVDAAGLLLFVDGVVQPIDMSFEEAIEAIATGRL